ncbi:hypothetical protein Bbelb_266400 [Branchiostoma belcheri]|nr:hypothetical protein Bbelb_266400 [Branchiostoma belcheri]
MSTQGVRRYFIFIKNKVSSDWKDLAWCLGFETPDIENIEDKRRDDKSRCMELLQEWHKRKGNVATIHVLMEALQEAELQHVVDSLKDRYPEINENPRSPASSSVPLADLPVHLYLGAVQQETATKAQTGDIDARVSERLLELERTLFTEDVLKDRRRYNKTREIFLSHKALLKDSFPGSILLLLTFLRQTDVDRFYHNHYKVGEGTLSQQLSHILISDDLQDKVKGTQLIVRLQVKHEDYVRVRARLGRGLDRTTSVDNLLALPPHCRHVDHSSLRGLDLAVIGREDRDLAVIGQENRPYIDGTDDITMPYRQVQSAVRATREKSKQEVKDQFETKLGQVKKEVKMLKEKNEKAEKILLEHKAEMQKLQETNKYMKKLLTIKQPVVRESQQQDPVKTTSGQHSMDKPTAAIDTGQVKLSVVKPKRNVKGANVRFGGRGSGRGKFNCPMGAAVSQDNKVYIADRYNSRIQVCTIAMNGVYIRQFTTTLPGETSGELEPHDVAVDRNDNLWVVGDNHVVQYSREGSCLVNIDLLQRPTGITSMFPRGITVAMATEQVIVTECDGQNGRLRVFNQDGSEVGTYGAGHRSPEPWWPGYVTVDGEGNILVTDYRNHCVHVLDREGNFKFKFGSEGSDKSQLKNPRGTCADGMGNIIVADKGNRCVKKFDSQGRFLCHIGSGMKGPQAVTVSPGGDVVVTDVEDHMVSVWTQG